MDIKQVRPINNMILVKVEKEPEKSSGGIIVPVAEKDRKQAAKDEGIIIALSPDSFPDEYFSLKPSVGDKIIFSKYAGVTLEQDNDIYKLMPDSEVYGFGSEKIEFKKVN